MTNNEAKILVVIKALIESVPVRLDGVEYNICENYDLCIPLEREASDGQRKVFYSKVDIGVGEFLRMCSELPDDKLTEIVSALTVKTFTEEG